MLTVNVIGHIRKASTITHRAGTKARLNAVTCSIDRGIHRQNGKAGSCKIWTADNSEGSFQRRRNRSAKRQDPVLRNKEGSGSDVDDGRRLGARADKQHRQRTTSYDRFTHNILLRRHTLSPIGLSGRHLTSILSRPGSTRSHQVPNRLVSGGRVFKQTRSLSLMDAAANHACGVASVVLWFRADGSTTYVPP